MKHFLSLLQLRKCIATVLIAMFIFNPLLVFAEESLVPISPTGDISNSALSPHPVEDEDEEDIDLGDDQAEMDAKKDMTGVVRQSKDYYCGPASLATLLTQLGDDTSEQEVLDQMLEADILPEKGVSLLTLKKAAQKLGSSPILKKWSADQVLSYIKDTQDPVLIHDEKKGVGGHFSVIREYDADKGIVELSDTEAGNIKYSVEDFKHIYTGSVLIISNDVDSAILNDISTNISDEEAMLIWGKYVPVYMAVEGMGAEEKAVVDEFKQCVAKAIKVVNQKDRNSQRATCYTKLSEKLKSPLNYVEEIQLAIKVNPDDLKNKDHETAVGTSDILSALDAILKAQTSYNQAFAIIGKSIFSSSRLSTLTTQLSSASQKVTNAKNDILLLENSLKSKKQSESQLSAELSKGSFTQNGQSFSLGTVGNQVTAQASTLSRLSANLKAKLSNLDGQIANLKRSYQSAQNNFNSQNSRAQQLQSQANSAYKSYQSASAKRQTSSAKNYYNQYSNFTNQANQARSQAGNYQNQMKSYQSQINSLEAQKNSAQKEVTGSSAELARLQRLKQFGETEIQRKKTIVTQLKNDILSLERQLPSKKNSLATLQSQLAPIQTEFDLQTKLKTYAPIRDKNISTIDTLKNRWGFTTITYSNTSETTRLKNEEISLVQGWDRQAELIATGDSKNINSLAISLFPYVGEGYDVLTLLGGKDPITKENLTQFTKVLTVAGLLSGVGSGTAARKVGTEALERIAKEIGVNMDEILPIAEKVAKNYQVSSIDDLKKLKGKLSISSFMDEVKGAAKGVTKVSARGVADEVVSVTGDVWLLNWSKRGKTIDMALGNNLGPTFKGVDILDNRTVISIKSMDISAETYKTASNLKSKLKHYVDGVKGFQEYGGVTSEMFDSRSIKLAIPDVNITQDQLDAIQAMKAYAQSQGIGFTIVIIK